jgi:hypothetical protein
MRRWQRRRSGEPAIGSAASSKSSWTVLFLLQGARGQRHPGAPWAAFQVKRVFSSLVDSVIKKLTLKKKY